MTDKDIQEIYSTFSDELESINLDIHLISESLISIIQILDSYKLDDIYILNAMIEVIDPLIRVIQDNSQKLTISSNELAKKYMILAREPKQDKKCIEPNI